MFQEKATDPVVHLVELYDEKQPRIHKFILPKSKVTGRGFTYYDEEIKRLVVPTEDEMQKNPDCKDPSFSEDLFGNPNLSPRSSYMNLDESKAQNVTVQDLLMENTGGKMMAAERARDLQIDQEPLPSQGNTFQKQSVSQLFS